MLRHPLHLPKHRWRIRSNNHLSRNLQQLVRHDVAVAGPDNQQSNRIGFCNRFLQFIWSDRIRCRAADLPVKVWPSLYNIVCDCHGLRWGVYCCYLLDLVGNADDGAADEEDQEDAY